MNANKKNKESVKEQVASKIDSITVTVEEPEKKEEKPVHLSKVELLNEKQIKVENATYKIVVNYREAVQPEALAERYNSILSKYDYIVGDWGYDQLRLKGFYQEDNHRAPFDKKINFLEDYLYEFCNFGCAYFVLEKEQSEKTNKSKSKRRKKRQNKDRKDEVQTDKNHNKNFSIKTDDKKRPTPQKKNEKQRKETNSRQSKTNQPKTSFQIHEKNE